MLAIAMKCVNGKLGILPMKKPDLPVHVFPWMIAIPHISRSSYIVYARDPELPVRDCAGLFGKQSKFKTVIVTEQGLTD